MPRRVMSPESGDQRVAAGLDLSPIAVRRGDPAAI